MNKSEHNHTLFRTPQFSSPTSKIFQLCTATVVPGKRVDSTPSLWVCASDKFSGQVAVMALDTGEITIESCSAIGNAAVTAMCTVPPPM